MSRSDEEGTESRLAEFLEAPSDDLTAWAELWAADRLFPVRTHRPGLAGRIIVGLKRLVRSLRPVVSAPQADLWERQRLFNEVLIRQHLILRRELDGLAADVDAIGKDVQRVQREILEDIRGIQRDINRDVTGLSQDIDDFRRKGMVDVMRHTDALFARLDQKVDRLRRVSLELAGGDPGKPSSD